MAHCLSQHRLRGRFLRGKQLVIKHCRNCHLDAGKLTGPPLLGVFERPHTKAWFMRFTHNSQAMIELGDKRAMVTWQAWQPTVMTSFHDLQVQEIADIYAYLESIR